MKEFLDLLIWLWIFGVWLFYFYAIQQAYPNWNLILGWIILIGIGIAFIAWSYNPPDIPLFWDAPVA